MRRHPALIPYSREHHDLLIVAQLLKSDAPAYPKLPSAWKDKINYAMQIMKTKGYAHMDREESELFPLLTRDKRLQAFKEKLSAEHQKLIQTMQSWEKKVPDPKTADSWARLLEDHIRFEERVVFQTMQEVMNDEQLNILRAD